MSRPTVARLHPALASAVLLLAAPPLRAQAPVALRVAAPSTLAGRAYAVDFSQKVAFQGERAGAEMNREARLRVALEAGAPHGARDIAVRIDTARGSAATPHNREVLDLRGLQGTRLVATLGDSGRPLAWRAPAPDLSFGDLGRMPLATVIDAVIPAVPGQPVATGATWERIITREAMHGAQPVRHEVRLRFTVEAIDRAAGATVARVRITGVGATGAPGAPKDYRASGTMLVDVADGTLRDLTIEEAASGTWEFNGELLPFIQTDVLRVTLRAAPAGRGR